MNSKNSKWRKIKSWNVGTPDGSTEKYTIYEDKDSGCFRIQNDFGNITIDMEKMSGYEFLKRAIREIENTMTPGDCDDDEWMFAVDWADGDSDQDTDCDGYAD